MKRTYLYGIMAALLLAVVALLFFFPDDIEGNVLQQHDIQQGLANGQEGKAFHELTGETTRWTNSLFGGMPNFQIAPSYPANDLMSWFMKVYTLGLPSPANLLFAMMVGFFIMCLCMDMKWYTSLFAAFAWGFSTYFIIIIGAGHIWKFITLAYIPPTIGGMALCYRGKYLAGTALTSLFGALQLMGNHLQMSYYFGIVMLCMVVAWGVSAFREKNFGRWGKATGCVLFAGVLALGACFSSLYNTYEYSKQTVRGHATELTASDTGQKPEGMDHSAITAWSYGLDETFSLLIPNIKGGASAKPVAGQMQMLSLAQSDAVADSYLTPQELQVVAQFPQYFGNQPGTNGPVYVGALVLMLAVLGMFTLQGSRVGPMKWALFAASVISIMLSWGHNFSGLTDFMIDHFPGYNKFRAVSSILVVVEFCIPLLAAMTLRQIVTGKDYFNRFKYQFYCVFGAGAMICLAGAFAPNVFGTPFSVNETEWLQKEGVLANPQYFGLIEGIKGLRYSMVKADSFRSLWFILAGGVVIWLYIKGKLKNRVITVSLLSVIVVVDLFNVNKRYVNSENFTSPVEDEVTFQLTAADQQIMQDKGNYRVLDIQGFDGARSSYFHKTIGGYHAAKLTRYNDLLNANIKRDGFSYLNEPLSELLSTGTLGASSKMNVLNMLNTKYIINVPGLDSIPVIVNPNALGNAWFVDNVMYVEDANAEMRQLQHLDTRHNAVADKQFHKLLGAAESVCEGDTIYETSYAPNRLEYKARTGKGGLAVFSEIYFPWGWKATIDGKQVGIGRVNYVLRALKIPAGEHQIVFTFEPESLKTCNAISVTSVIAIYILCIVALAIFIIGVRKEARHNPK